jgi:hypothetical protein
MLKKGAIIHDQTGLCRIKRLPPVENSEFEGCDLVIISLVVAISVPALL